MCGILFHSVHKQSGPTVHGLEIALQCAVGVGVAITELLCSQQSDEQLHGLLDPYIALEIY